MSDDNGDRSYDRWARLRFSIVGPLLAAPPRRGQLHEALEELSQRQWVHPVTGESAHFGVSTIERWFYLAKNDPKDPIGALRRRVRKDAGSHPGMIPKLRQAIEAQYREHPSWSYQLHADNLVVIAERAEIEPAPSCSTVRRYMKAHGLFRKKRRRTRDTPGARRAAARLEACEVRSYEVEYVHGLWHFDFHEGSRSVLLADGTYHKPQLLGVLDDRSRLCCHMQWYLDESSETLAHGLGQAFQKRGLPRAVLSDNGGAMKAGETTQGFEDLSIIHERTLPESPYQNAKQENFWVSVEGRLMPMLEGKKDLTLDFLNEATQAWVEREYNRHFHSEIGMAPLERYLDDRNVGRDCPSSEALRRAFRIDNWRTQRRSDGTISVEGRRFEIPGRYRQLERVRIRYARWNLTAVDLIDGRTREVLCPLYPVDKVKNAEGQRRRLEPITSPTEIEPVESEIAPLLEKLMAEYAATGLPPAYLPKHDDEETNK